MSRSSWVLWCWQRIAAGSRGGRRNEARFSRLKCDGLGRRSAVVALLSPAARGHRPGAGERRAHGGDDALPLDPHPDRRARDFGGRRPVCARAEALYRAILESVGYELALALERMRELLPGWQPVEVRALGGGAAGDSRADSEPRDDPAESELPTLSG